MDMSIVATETDKKVDISLFKQGKPTPAFVVLAAAELAVDVALGVAVYKLAKLFSRK